MILEGMRRSLTRAQDVIVFTEIDENLLVPAGSSKERYLALLSELGFTPVDLYNGLAKTDWKMVRQWLARAHDYCFRLRRQPAATDRSREAPAITGAVPSP